MAKLGANSAFSDPKLHSLDHFPISSSDFFPMGARNVHSSEYEKHKKVVSFTLLFSPDFAIVSFYLHSVIHSLTFAFRYFVDLSHGVL